MLAGKIARIGRPGDAIGVMLPNANGAGIAFLAVMSAGRTPAMINFTAGAANILAACEAAQVKTIVTSRGFIEKAKLEKLVAALEEKVALVYLEDIRTRISFADRLRAFRRLRKPVVPRNAEETAAILFTSGSEGAPKGVALSHRNMLANAAQAAARIDFGRTDKVFNVLPMFHSFGLTVGFTLPSPPVFRSIFIPRPCTIASCRNSFTAQTPRFFSGPTLFSRVMRDRPTLMTSGRFVMSSPAPSR